MTDPSDSVDSASLDETRLAGHTIEELSDYLDRGRTPPDPSIEESPECQLALAALERLGGVSLAVVEQDAEREGAPSESWIRGVLSNITREVRAGRRIPIGHDHTAAELSVTEGAVRALIRAAGDSVAGAVVGRSALDGDVTVPGSAIQVAVTITALDLTPLSELAQRVRAAVSAALARHTELRVIGIDVTIQDIRLDRSPAQHPGTDERSRADG